MATSDPIDEGVPGSDAGTEELNAAALRLLSERADVVLNSVAEGVYCLDTDGRTIFVNEAGARMFGYSPREMLGKRQHEMVHHHYANGKPFPIEECPLFSSVRDGVTQQVRGDTFWHKDGHSVPVDYTAIPLKHGRRILGGVVTFRDISAEQRVERQKELLERLRTSEKRLKLAMRAGRMASWEWDMVGNTVYWSPEEERLYGLEPGTFDGTVEGYVGRIHPDDRQMAWETLERSMAEGADTHHVTHRVVWPDESVRYLESHGIFVRDNAGKPVSLVGVSIDATERMQAHRQLQDALELAPSAISMTEGPDHVLRWANAMSRRLVGKRDVMNRPAREALPELEGQGFFEILDGVYTTGEVYAADDVRVVWDREGDGQLHESWFNIVYQPMRDANGTITGVMSHSVPVRHADGGGG